MGYRDAVEDGIEIISNPGHRETYKIPCEMCNRKLIRTQYSRKRNYICDYCKGLITEKEKIYISKEILDTETRAEKRFREAISEIEKQVKNINGYERAIKNAKSRAEKYDSIPEAMVAIELIRLGYKIIPQQKAGKYKVDFAIPEHKLVIEVDGKLFHQTKTDREAIVQLSFGLDWKIVHIPAELIRKDIQKLNEIMKLYVTK